MMAAGISTLAAEQEARRRTRQEGRRAQRRALPRNHMRQTDKRSGNGVDSARLLRLGARGQVGRLHRRGGRGGLGRRRGRRRARGHGDARRETASGERQSKKGHFFFAPSAHEPSVIGAMNFQPRVQASQSCLLVVKVGGGGGGGGGGGA